jgi:FkbM family methyltransferase
MLRNVRGAVRNGLLRLGWDVRRVQSLEATRRERVQQEQLAKWRFLGRYGLKSILDIGANTGQFAELAREIVPEARIYSFEPLAECHAELSAKLGRLAPAEAFRFALGDESGTAVIQRNGFTPSSSLLTIRELHTAEMPETATSRAEPIEIRRLDDVFADRPLESPCFIKIDVQGFEDRVLRGGRRIVQNSVGVVLEASSYRLYDGQPLFEDLHATLKEWGFVYRGNVDQWLSQKDGRILQFDALFENVAGSEGLE